MRHGQWELLIALLWISIAVTSCTAAPRESRFLWLSDIHFNPMADAALVDELVKADPAQWEAVLNRTSPAEFSQYKSDTNWWLLKSALQQMPKTVGRPAIVIVTGDLLAHGFPQLYKAAMHDEDQQHYGAFVKKTVQFLALQLRAKFPGTRIYVTPGNNDNDCGDYSIQADGAFLDDTAAIARELADGDSEFAASWKLRGSFNVAHPTVANARLISLNSIFWSQKYEALSPAEGCKPVASNASAELMTWLEESLAAAQRAHEKVWLMFHIPPGIDGYASAMKRKKSVGGGATDDAATCAQAIVPMWKVEWTAQFDALLAKYGDTVTAAFAAHTHSDDFRVIGTAGEGQQFVLMAPAISPIYQQNPSFRVVSYQADGSLADQTTYFLTNLPATSAKTKGRWKKEYTYSSQWKAPGINGASLNSVYNRVVAEESARAEWLKFYAVSGPALEGEKPIVQPLYCAVEGLSVESYRQCWCGGPVVSKGGSTGD
jgi:hypothetical protein